MGGGRPTRKPYGCIVWGQKPADLVPLMIIAVNNGSESRLDLVAVGVVERFAGETGVDLVMKVNIESVVSHVVPSFHW